METGRIFTLLTGNNMTEKQKLRYELLKTHKTIVDAKLAYNFIMGEKKKSKGRITTFLRKLLNNN